MEFARLIVSSQRVTEVTLPEHILDDLRGKLHLSKDVHVVALSNDRPNVALSCRTTPHPAESFADLRFLIPEHASVIEDIPITLTYCNERRTAEQAYDSLCCWAAGAGFEDPSSFIVFYHAKIGTERKRQIVEGLCDGSIQIAICTDAVGMVC
jgi:superfamily II DNA helicase RecQ